ncbi:MAG TPA: ferredoxin [Candidatus Woesearchaeota archaeon]|jgi:ferredoxin|nr:ferredoxin [Candidatus Woesearchaeota archaeon]
MKYKIEINESLCVGCGACQAICPDVYEMDDNNKPKLKENPTAKECAKEAADSCPVSAIDVKTE